MAAGGSYAAQIEQDIGSDEEEGLVFGDEELNNSSHRTRLSTAPAVTGSISTSQHQAAASSSSGAAAGSGPAGQKGGSYSFWTLPFYARYFDLDTDVVLRRCLAAVYPRADFVAELNGKPDLYGPFWIGTTVVMILFLTGTISRYIALRGADGRVQYDFTLLSGAAGLIYGYTWIVPIGLWAAMKWYCHVSVGLLDCWCLYGYANLVWIPVALASWSPLTLLNYIFAAAGFAVSGMFLLKNLYHLTVKRDNQTEQTATQHRASQVLILVAGALHAGLAIAIKVLFFAHGSPLKN